MFGDPPKDSIALADGVYITNSAKLPISRITRSWRFAELSVRASYFGGCVDWFSLVGGTIPFSRR